MRHYYDAVVVGAGGAGLTAVLQLAAQKNLRVAVVTKLFPTRSHTGAAQGGVSAAIGNAEEDRWLWHMFDTIKGGDYLSDQDAVEVLCRQAPESIYELEHFGLPFSRTAEGRIAQRKFGGHTRDFGAGPVRRACYARDRVGQLILQTLYQQCVKYGVVFHNEYHMTELLLKGDRVVGLNAVEVATGRIHTFLARAVLLATGGFGRIYDVTSNAYTLTGDGAAAVLRAGLPLEDMEFYQFHPTGLGDLGILITEGARGEGGRLLNGSGDRFMKDHAPELLDLAPRDLVARAIFREAQEGRGVNKGDCVHLDLTHLGPETLQRKLPEISELVTTYLGLDPGCDLIPVQPTAHYAMGGMPTDLNGRVRTGAGEQFCRGLFAAGECACVSIHGANRLGANSLLELVVMGRRAGRAVTQFLDEDPRSLVDLDSAVPEEPAQKTKRLLSQLLEGESQDPGLTAKLRVRLQKSMTGYASVLRTERGLQSCLNELKDLCRRYEQVRVHDRGSQFNMELWAAVELGNLLLLAETLVTCALARKESRGAHYRKDHPNRDDDNWLKHSFVCLDSGQELKLTYRPVTITRFDPEARDY